MQLNPYLMFNGQCREAFEFYRECLGGNLNAMTYGDAPAGYGPPTDEPGRIMHATLKFDGGVLMGSDAPSGNGRLQSSTHLAIEAVTLERAETLFAALSDGAHVSMPLGETFWAKRFGMLTDRFGVPWMVNAGEPEGADILTKPVSM